MGNKSKLISGIILFAIGVIIAYETVVYNLLDILLIIGFIIAMVGIVFVIVYFVDNNADRTNNILKEFLDSNQINSDVFPRFERSNNSNEGPLKIHRQYDEYNDDEYKELNVEDYQVSHENNGSSFSDFFTAQEENPKAVLRVNKQKEKEVDLDNQLDFTPYYGKPLKVTRAPKKRSTRTINDNIQYSDRESGIQRALTQNDESINTNPAVEEIVPEHREIKIDLNNPESLPVPRSLKGNIITDEGLLSTEEAFDQLSFQINKELMLEIPSLNELSDRFLSHVPTIYSRVIISEFNLSDMSYTFLISSLLKQGVHIKTVPKVYSTNLITDDSYAMIISQGQDNEEYGAIFNDRISISNIRADFEKIWNIASNLDEEFIMNSMQGGVNYGN